MTADLIVPTPVTDPDSGDDSLLESKFEMPESPCFMVARPRLLEQLSHGAGVPVSLVVGPAGSGKTQLVASWVTSEWVNAPVAWVTVEDDDDRTGVFWAYVVEALRRAGVAATPPLTPLTSTATVDRSFLVRLTAALAQQQKPVVLVLDGVSNLTGGQWAADLAFVLRHTGSLLRLVLVGRWDPPLPLHRYRLAGRLNEIRSKDLAFTADEAADLLTQHGVELSPAGLASLLEHTEGWAAGLRLFAMALEDRHDADRLVDVITGNEATIAEYFVDEVLRLQPAHVRAFLLEASILETFTPELAEAVTGRSDSRRLLMELQRQNAFVQRAGEYSTAYRIHRLFAELLRAQLVCEAPELTAQLHRRAADWFAAQGQTVEAVSHAVKAGAWVAAATIIIEHYAIGRLVLDGGASRLGALVRHLPGDLDSPEVATVAAASALADRATDRCAQQVSRVHELMMRREYVCGDALALAEFLVEVLLADLCGDSSQVLHTTSLIDYFVTQVPPKQLTRHPELRALILAARGAAQSRVGAIDAATVTLTEAAAIAEPGCEYPRIDCLQHLALIEAYRGRLRRAEKLADEAIDLADRCGVESTRRPIGAELALAWVAMERYDIDAAGRHLRAADPRFHPHCDGLAAAAFALVKARRLQARGELRGAMRALRNVAATPDGRGPPEWLAREIMLSEARLMIASGRPDQAVLAIGRFPEPQTPDVIVVHAAALAAGGDIERARETITPVACAAGLDSPVAVEAWLVLATLAAQCGEVDNARSGLRHALWYALPEAQRRSVQQVWARLRRVLRDDDELAGQYRQLQVGAPGGNRQIGQPPGPDSPLIVEPLSRREMEVLQGLAAMLPTEEIAAKLYVSVNTVKTHVRSILRKLSASRRNEAVRRARALGLV